MPSFMTTPMISAEIHDIITTPDSSDRIVLVSPYLRINDRLKEDLEYQDKNHTQIIIIYGKTELNPAEAAWLGKTRIITKYRENLHAKCYLNDSKALMTSMNLYEFSEKNNDEFGISVSAKDDAELYRQIRDEVEKLIQRSDDVRLPAFVATETEPPTVSVDPPVSDAGDDALFDRLRDLRSGLAKQRDIPVHYIFEDSALQQMVSDRPQNDEAFLAIRGVGPKKLADYGPTFLSAIRGDVSPSEPSTVVPPQRTTAYCLRCGTKIALDLDKPYCGSHWKSWSRYKNRNYSEKHCHTCGREQRTTMAKPQCRTCYAA